MMSSWIQGDPSELNTARSSLPTPASSSGFPEIVTVARMPGRSKGHSLILGRWKIQPLHWNIKREYKESSATSILLSEWKVLEDPILGFGAPG